MMMLAAVGDEWPSAVAEVTTRTRAERVAHLQTLLRAAVERGCFRQLRPYDVQIKNRCKRTFISLRMVRISQALWQIDEVMHASDRD